MEEFLYVSYLLLKTVSRKSKIFEENFNRKDLGFLCWRIRLRRDVGRFCDVYVSIVFIRNMRVLDFDVDCLYD